MIKKVRAVWEHGPDFALVTESQAKTGNQGLFQKLC